MRKDIREAHDRFYLALNAIFTGDLDPMREIWDDAPDVTQCGPFGGRLVGYHAVLRDFEQASARVGGGHVEAKDVLVRAEIGDIGFTVCLEEGQNIDLEGNRIAVRHRATNVFRRAGDSWKLIHHHTDEAPGLQGMGKPG
jgi:ketosteroid isomerase-like protein